MESLSDFSINPTPCDRLRKVWLALVMQDALKLNNIRNKGDERMASSSLHFIMPVIKKLRISMKEYLNHHVGPTDAMNSWWILDALEISHC